MSKTKTATDYSTFTVKMDDDESKEVTWRAFVDDNEIVGKPWMVEKPAERIGNILAVATILALAAMLYLGIGVFLGWMIWG